MSVDDRTPDERRVAELVASLADADFQLDEPPADLFDRVAGATAPVVGAPEVPARRRSRTTWTVIGAAAAVLLVLALAAGAFRRADRSAGEVAARARLTSDGLAHHSDLVGEASLVQVGDEEQIDLDLPGLPTGTADFYEVWLIAPDGTRLQSLGVTDGHGRYLVPRGIDPRAYPLVDVSREPPDGNPAHSGDSLVRGRLDV